MLFRYHARLLLGTNALAGTVFRLARPSGGLSLPPKLGPFILKCPAVTRYSFVMPFVHFLNVRDESRIRWMGVFQPDAEQPE